MLASSTRSGFTPPLAKERSRSYLYIGPHENPKEMWPVVPTTTSQRNVVKQGKNLGRNARKEKYKRATTTKRFCDSAALNGHLRGGGWQDLLINSMNLEDFKEVIKEQYPVIDDGIISCLVFCCYKHIGKDAMKKAVYIRGGDGSLPGKVQI